MFNIIAFSAAVVLLYYLATKIKSGNYRMPNGPMGVPFFGNMFQVVRNPHIKFSKWAYKYGNIFSVNILGRPVVIANDVKTIKQIFGTLESTGRYNFEILDSATDGKNGVFAAEGKEWQELRIFTMKALRDSGISKSSVVEPCVWECCEWIFDWFENETKNSSNTGLVIDIHHNLVIAMVEVLWAIFTRGGPKTDHGKILGQIIVDYIDTIQVTTKSGLLFLPWLKHIIPERSGYNASQKVVANMHKQMQRYFDLCKEHRQNYKVQPEDRNLFEVYLEKWENCTNPESCFYGNTGYRHMFHSILILFNAGGETIATTINWVINYLVAHPDIQEKLYEQVNTVCGNEMPALANKKVLPYLEAVVYESLRMSAQIPFGIIHKLLDNVQFGKYRIPKNTTLIANIYHVHNDKSIWGDPQNFRPERFLEVSAEQRNKLIENVISFQAGKRVCVGEGLSKDVLFLVVARLVQKFQFSAAPGKAPREYIDPVVGYFLLPKQLGVTVKARPQ